MKNSKDSNMHQALIRTALQQVTGHDTWDELTPLTRGMSGASIYKVTVDRHIFVARISSHNHWTDAHEHEFANMQLASNCEVSPHVYYADHESGIVLMKYIETQALQELTAGDQRAAQSLAKLVARIHHCSEFSAGPKFFQIAKGLWQNLGTQYRQHDLVSQSGKLLASLAQQLNDPQDIRPAHRDINPYNLLFDGNDYYLVDWEAAAQDNLYLDLATCVNYYFHDKPEAANYFLEQYFGKALTKEQQYKLHLMRIAAYIYLGCGFLLMAAGAGQSILANPEIDALPTYAEYMQLIGKSKNLSEPSVQQEFGFVCFKQVRVLSQDQTPILLPD